MDLYQEILAAEKRLRANILKTPLVESFSLSKLINGRVFLKLENEQYTGSFKARGSLNKLMSLSDSEREKGAITASTGNHALGFSRACKITNTKGTVYLPNHASKAKIELLKNYPVDLKFYGDDPLSTEIHAKQVAEETNKIWVSPYNDKEIIAGQGTIGIELCEQLEHFDHVFITVGGGGLISGIGSYLKKAKADTKIISCEPENSKEMALSLKAGKIVDQDDAKETLSDGSAGGIEPKSITFPICQSIIDDTITVNEDEIASALKIIVHEQHKIIEGSAAVAVASLIKEKEKFQAATVVVVICGANIDLKLFKSLI